MKTILFGILGIGLLTSLTGCTVVDSSTVDSGNIMPELTIQSDDKSATVTAIVELSANGQDLDLKSGDELSCDGESTTRSEVLGIVKYRAEISRRAPGDAYRCTLTRPSGESLSIEGAELEAIGVSAPPEAGTASISKGIKVVWAPTAEENVHQSVTFEGTCIEEKSFDLNAVDSSFTVPAGSLKSKNGNSLPCVGSYTVTRTRTGGHSEFAMSGIVDVERASRRQLTFAK